MSSAPMLSPLERLNDPELFLQMDDLHLVAQSIVEGTIQGWHRSPFIGSGAEFDSHREYRPGDDLRYLNWNLFASHDRLYTKLFRAETNLNLYLLLDATGSMGTRHGPFSKFRYASRAIAALAFLARRTRDTAGLYLLRDRISAAVVPSARSGQFDDLLGLLENSRPEGPADISQALDEVTQTCRRRGIIVLLSDFFGREEPLLRGLRSMREQGHEVFAIQVLDPWECELPAKGDFEFTDLETGAVLKTSAPDIRDRYAQNVSSWRASLKCECEASGIDWASTTTKEPIMQIIREFLACRDSHPK